MNLILSNVRILFLEKHVLTNCLQCNVFSDTWSQVVRVNLGVTNLGSLKSAKILDNIGVWEPISFPGSHPGYERSDEYCCVETTQQQSQCRSPIGAICRSTFLSQFCRRSGTRSKQLLQLACAAIGGTRRGADLFKAPECCFPFRAGAPGTRNYYGSGLSTPPSVRAFSAYRSCPFFILFACTLVCLRCDWNVLPPSQVYHHHYHTTNRYSRNLSYS